MNCSRISLGLAAGLLIVGAPSAFPHALRHDLSDRATAVRWTYDGGAPAADCEVSVRAPGGADVSYARGVTDQNGTFAFLADTNGRWTVTVVDGQGHRADVYVDVVEGVTRFEAATSAPRQPGATLVGISILFGLFGLYAMLIDRFRRRNGAGPA